MECTFRTQRGGWGKLFALSSVTSCRVQRLVKEQAMGPTRAIGSSVAPKAAPSSSQWTISSSATHLAAVALMHKNKSMSKTTTGAATITPSMGTITKTVYISSTSSPTATLASTSIVLAALLSHKLLASSLEPQRWRQYKNRSTTGLLHHLHRSTLASGCASPWRTVSVGGRCFSVVLCLDGLLQGCMSECCWSVHHSCVSGISNTYTLNSNFFFFNSGNYITLHYIYHRPMLAQPPWMTIYDFLILYTFFYFFIVWIFFNWVPLLCPGWVNDTGKSHIL